MKLACGAAGLVVGFFLGWLAFSGGQVPPPDTPPPEHADRGGPNGHGPLSPAPTPPADESGSAAAEVAARAPETFRGGTAREISNVVEFRDHRPTEAEVGILRNRLDSAIEARNRDLLNGVLTALVLSRRPSAERALLGVVTDERLSTLRGELFADGLWTSDLPGIAAAARQRLLMNVDAGETSWVGGVGWFDLVAQHGTTSDLEWLTDEGWTGQLRLKATEALAKAENPVAVRRLEELVRLRKFPLRELGEFVRHSPGRAFALLHDRLVEGLWEEPGSSPNKFFRWYGASVPEERLATARDALLGLRETPHRVAAVYAVQQMALRGLDTTNLEPIILTPVEFLERPGTAAEITQRGLARYAIEYNRVAWSERAAIALESAGFETQARRVRAGLRDG